MTLWLALGRAMTAEARREISSNTITLWNQAGLQIDTQSQLSALTTHSLTLKPDPVNPYVLATKSDTELCRANILDAPADDQRFGSWNPSYCYVSQLLCY